MAKKASSTVPELAAFDKARKACEDLKTEIETKKKELDDLLAAPPLSPADYRAVRKAASDLDALVAKAPALEADMDSAKQSAVDALNAYIAAQQAAKAAAAASPKPAAPAPLPAANFPDTIAGSGMKVVSDKIGGTTGAKLVEINGEKYIFKTTGKVSPEHVRNEAAADQAYRRAGIRVPDCRIYEEGGVTYKLSQFIEGGTSLGEYMAKATPAQKKAVVDELKQGYILDSLFANWDVLGTDQDNVLIDKDGHAWRIDNGSSFAYRAQGSKKKPEEWEKREWPDEWRTLRTSPINKGVFDQLTAHDIFSSKVDLDAAVAGLPEETKKALAKPLEELKQMQSRCANFDVGGYAPAHTSDVLEASYDLSKDGLREIMPKKIAGSNPQGDAAFGMFRVKNGGGNAIKPDASPASAVIQAAISIGHHIKTGDFTPNSGAINAALSFKPALQAASAWDKNAKALLDAIDKIEESQKGGFKTPIPHVNQVSVIMSDPSASSSGRTFWDSVSDVAAKTGVDAKIAPTYFRQQGGSSSNIGSLKLKAIELEAMGADLSNVSAVRGIWVRPGLEKIIKHYTSNPAEFERDKKSYALFKAATQLMLENTDFETRDMATRTVRILRTSEKDTLGLKPGDIGEYADEGAHESYGLLHSVEVYCRHAYIRDVPFSRVSSVYFATTPVDPDRLYLGDDENEIGANGVGLPAYYVGDIKTSNNVTGAPVKWGTRIRDFDAMISKAESNSGRTLRDYQ